jgi:hypothetical protein
MFTCLLHNTLNQHVNIKLYVYKSHSILELPTTNNTNMAAM